MADVKISQLPQASLPLTGAEVFPLVQNGVTVQASVTSVGTAANIAALRAITPTTGVIINTDGYYTVGDGGGAQFYAATGAAVGTYVDNGGSIIVPTGGDGSSAWLAITNGTVNVLTFGADKTGLSNSTDAIQAAIAAGKIIYFPPGVYKCNILMQNVYGKRLKGAGVGTKGATVSRLIPNDTTLPVIKTTQNAVDVWLEDLYIDAQLSGQLPTTPTGTGVLLQAYAPYVFWRGGVRNLFIFGFQDGFVLDCDINAGEIFANMFYNIEVIGCSRYSIKLRGIYNHFDKIFATQCQDYSIYSEASACAFDNVIGDQRMEFRGANQYVRNLYIEGIYGTTFTGTGAALTINGTNSIFDGVSLTNVNDTEYPIGISIFGVNQAVRNVTLSTIKPDEPIRINGGATGILESVFSNSAVIPMGTAPTLPSYLDNFRFRNVSTVLFPTGYSPKYSDPAWTPLASNLLADNSVTVGSGSTLDTKLRSIGPTTAGAGADITSELYVGASAPTNVFSTNNYGWSFARTRTAAALTGRMSVYEYINNGGVEQKTERLAMDSGGNFRPAADNAQSLGTAANRWSVVYAATGAINTSDLNQKQQVRSVEAKEKAVGVSVRKLMKAFKFNNAVESKGDNARIHFGAIAQDVKKAFEDQGLDPHAYGIFCEDVWYEYNGEVVPVNDEGNFVWSRYELDGNIVDLDENGNMPEGAELVETAFPAERKTRLGLRYEELLALIISSL
jgi:hypothetical protein